ncbi:Proteinase inhibitor I25, cystatin domain-containing protein [Strongyloides ratti]|uniref:Proteinase inhibitor I25, cystatin domain-containing protein n=1 Tax=Strongyloides ratti TaxID=34506 RepID=A0A090LLJ9_STRRB|nr:Proteinase inhibitor I25, cystatin domain-containing protein [Strongyloides ratti]CEF69048.1 Proteinase inhibitor I25, cystatin domain-containing protein [Strongyloides ratti]
MASNSMPGGWKEQSIDDKDIILLGQKSVDKFNQQSNDLAYHGFVKVISAKSQVVAGVNYELQVLVGETGTLKNVVPHDKLTEEHKKVKDNGRKQIVTVGVWLKPWEDFEEYTIKGVKQA